MTIREEGDGGSVVHLPYYHLVLTVLTEEVREPDSLLSFS